jgi:hypothetical protein
MAICSHPYECVLPWMAGGKIDTDNDGQSMTQTWTTRPHNDRKHVLSKESAP